MSENVNKIKMHREGVIYQTMHDALTEERSESVYPLTMGWSMSYVDKNEFGDNYFGNKGVRVFKGDKEYEYVINNYIPDAVGYILYGGDIVLKSMIEDIMHDVYGYRRIVPDFVYNLCSTKSE